MRSFSEVAANSCKKERVEGGNVLRVEDFLNGACTPSVVLGHRTHNCVIHMASRRTNVPAHDCVVRI